jgi:8-oxo-dGTP pyrophosphatase MutT (NUDIX family)
VDTIQNLRQYIGHAPILMVGAGALIVDKQDRLLLMKRSDNDSWGMPGGAMELGEAAETTARREVFEETGLELGELSLFGVFSGPEFFYRYPNGDEVHNVTIVYLNRDWHGKVRLNSEHTDWCWFSPKDIPENINLLVQLVVEQFVKTHG